ncbi:MAG TPA: hypothetical protein VM049_04820 [Gaiellaceae bacterium]|nr:hypothetical protein [Gaiellaceae bacterium]
MSKLLIGLLGAGVIATGGYAAASGLEDSQPARTVSLPAATTSDDTTQGATTPATTTAATTAVAAELEHVSGPCDEAEHTNDPRCGGAASTDDDRSGSDQDPDDGDRSGSNSGKG